MKIYECVDYGRGNKGIDFGDAPSWLNVPNRDEIKGILQDNCAYAWNNFKGSLFHFVSSLSYQNHFLLLILLSSSYLLLESSIVLMLIMIDTWTHA